MFAVRLTLCLIITLSFAAAWFLFPLVGAENEPAKKAAEDAVPAIEPDPEGFQVVNTQDPKDIPTPAEQSLKQMTALDGFKITQSAAEPEVRQPIAFTIDDRGRLWVVENYSYPKWRNEPTDRVLIFEDTTGDGRFDRRRIFWDQGRNLSGIALGFGGVYLTSAPELIFIPVDAQNDRPAGEPVVLLDGFDAGAVGHNVVNGLTWAPDGWLYGNHGIQATSHVGKPGAHEDERTSLNCCIWRYHPTRQVFEVVARGTTNPWGFDYNDHGHMFFTNNVNGHLFHLLPGARYIRMYGSDFNPHNYEFLQPSTDHKHFAGDDWGASRAKSDGTQDHEHDHLGGGHSHVGAMFYLGDNWPEQYRDQIFMFNTHGRRINQDRIKRNGAGYIATHAPDILHANDPWFRGLELMHGPDGGVFFTDWNQFGECHDHDGIYRGSGRIYKLTWGEVEPVLDLNLAERTDDELVQLQLHANDWYVRQARRILHERAAEGRDLAQVHAALHKIFRENDQVTRKLRAMWALYVTEGIDHDWILQQLDHESEHIRVWAIRMLVDHRQPTSEAVERFAVMADNDPSDLVRLHLASALQWMPLDQRGELAAVLAKQEQLADDPVFPLMVWYGLEPLAAAGPEGMVAQLTQMKIPQVRRFTARRLAAEIGSSPEAIERLLVLLAESDDPSLQRDLADGLHEGLRGRRRIRQPSQWPKAYAALAEHDQADLRQRAEALGLIFGDDRAGNMLRRIAADPEAELDERRQAIQSLADQGVEGLAPTLQLLIADRQVRRQAIRALAAAEVHRDTPAVLIDRFGDLTPEERREAIDTLTSRAEYATSLLAAIDDERIARNDLSAVHARQIVALGNDDLTQRLTETWGLVRRSSDQARERIAHFREKLTPEALAEADTVAGKLLFTQRCGQCHKLFDVGQSLEGENIVGGDLTGSDRANLDYLLMKIVDPSATVPQDNRMSIVMLSDGRVLSGIVTGQTDATLRLRTPAETVVIDREEIEERKLLDTSLMPEGLLDELSDEQLHNLFRFLSGG